MNRVVKPRCANAGEKESANDNHQNRLMKKGKRIYFDTRSVIGIVLYCAYIC